MILKIYKISISIERTCYTSLDPNQFILYLISLVSDKDTKEVKIRCVNIPGWNTIDVNPTSGPCKGGTLITGTFPAHVGTPKKVLFAQP